MGKRPLRSLGEALRFGKWGSGGDAALGRGMTSIVGAPGVPCSGPRDAAPNTMNERRHSFREDIDVVPLPKAASPAASPFPEA